MRTAMPLLSGRDDTAASFDEDIAARAARLGITEERVLEEYRRIGFSDISRILSWDEDGKLKAMASSQLDPDDAPAIAEIVASASNRKIYRVKLHDKRPALDALARVFGMLPPLRHASDAEDANDRTVDPREAFVRAVDQVTADAEAEQRDPQT
jgi:hypothetical protein